MDPYSATLGLAIAAAACALGLALVSRPPWSQGSASHRSSAARSGAAVAGVTALTLVILSAAFHVTAGHAPGSDSALGPAAFLAAHPALVVTAALAALPLVVLRVTRANPGSARR